MRPTRTYAASEALAAGSGVDDGFGAFRFVKAYTVPVSGTTNETRW